MVQAVPFISVLVGKLLYWVLWGTNAFYFCRAEFAGRTGDRHLDRCECPHSALSGDCRPGRLDAYPPSGAAYRLFGRVVARWSFFMPAGPIHTLSSVASPFIIYSKNHRSTALTASPVIRRVVCHRTTLPYNGPPNHIATACRARYSLDRTFAEKDASGQWFYQNGLLRFYDQNILVVDDPATVDALTAESPLRVEVALLRNSPRLQIADVQQSINADHWVFDGSNYPSRVAGWLEECRTLGLQGHATAEDGAFTIEIGN